MLASHHAVPLSRSRSLATAAVFVIASPDVIASVPSAACFVVIRSAPASSSRFGSRPVPITPVHRSPRSPSPPFHPFRLLLPHRLGIIISSSRLRVISSPPLATPYLSRNGEGILTGCGCGMFRCRCLVACLPDVVSPSRVIWLNRFHLVPVVISCGLASCFLACADGGVRAIAPCELLRLLPRWSVLIIFKMFPC